LGKKYIFFLSLDEQILFIYPLHWFVFVFFFESYWLLFDIVFHYCNDVCFLGIVIYICICIIIFFCHVNVISLAFYCIITLSASLIIGVKYKNGEKYRKKNLLNLLDSRIEYEWFWFIVKGYRSTNTKWFLLWHLEKYVTLNLFEMSRFLLINSILIFK